MPIPGDSIASDSNTPNQQFEFQPLPDYMGNTFPALCKLWVIANDFIWHYYDHDDTMAPMKRAGVELERAHNVYRRLLAWADALPIDMVRGNANKHHTIMAHTFYHAVILDVFRPFMQLPGSDTRIDPYTAADATAVAVHAASTKQLLRLALLYRARFQPIISFLWQTILLYVANIMLSRATITNANPEPNSTMSASPAGQTAEGRAGRLSNRRWLRLCLKGYKTMYKSFPFAERTVLGLLSMAMRNRTMTASEARAVMSDLRGSVPDREPYASATATAAAAEQADDGEDMDSSGSMEDGESPGVGEEPTAMIDLDLAMSDPLASRVQTLAAQFQELALFEEFTTVEPEEEVMDWGGSLNEGVMKN